MTYVDAILESFEEHYAEEPHYVNAVKEFLNGVRPAIDAEEDKYRDMSILERMLLPERSVMFRVSWVDDQGKIRVNNGYRVQYNSALGPYVSLRSLAMSRYPAPRRMN